MQGKSEKLAQMPQEKKTILNENPAAPSPLCRGSIPLCS